MIDEVKGLLAEGVSAESLMYYGLEYKFVTEYVTGKTTYNDMLSRLKYSDTPVCKASDDMVPRNGAGGHTHQLDRRLAADG